MYFLAEPLAFLIRPIYSLITDYGLTLIVVTILIKLITIPLTIMSQKSSTKMQLIQPELQKLQHKYRNDQNMLSVEMQKLYKKHNISPLGGCLPLIVQMFVLFGFIRVVYDPLTYMLQLTPENVDSIKNIMGVGREITSQVQLCGIEGFKEALASIKPGVSPIDFDFFGIDLTRTLSSNPKDILLWIFPVLAVVATYISSLISKKQMNANKDKKASKTSENDQAQNMSNTMMTVMPIMTAVFTYTMPIGMSLYWFISTAFQLIQQAIITKLVKKNFENNMTSERNGKK